MVRPMLIRDAEIRRHGRADLRLSGNTVAAIGRLDPLPGERVIDADGGTLLPGLHDHHIHLNALAARAASVWCGPPEVSDEAALAAALARTGSGWLRGMGYHESVCGLPDALALDRLCPDRPLRIQHRSGRMWLLNSAALADLLGRAEPPPGLEREGGRFTGRLFDEDRWLSQTLAGSPPDLAALSASLAAFGVTGVTDMSPANDPAMAAHFARQRYNGALRQSLVLAGALSLADATPDVWRLGPVKLHLHENALPDFAEAADLIRAAHGQGRGVAVHCTTEVEMVFTLALFEEAGTLPGDRIEHASIADPGHVARMAQLGLQVCVQPHFLTERGDHYRESVEQRLQPHLYRLASLRDAGLVLAGGSDAPFGSADPWAAMRGATDRQTAQGVVMGAEEALDADAALALWLADPLDLSRERRIAVGGAADLCLLAANSCSVRLTVSAGQVIHDGIDQPPVDRRPG